MIFDSMGLNSPPDPLPSLPSPRGRSCGGWGYPKMKIKTIFEIPLLKTLELMYHMFFGGINPLAPLPPPKGALAVVRGNLK